MKKKPILVMGDPVLDVYHVGTSFEGCVEGPFPCVRGCVTHVRPGGAARVAWALSEMGQATWLHCGNFGNGGASWSFLLSDPLKTLAPRCFFQPLPRHGYRLGLEEKHRVVVDGRVLFRYDVPAKGVNPSAPDAFHEPESLEAMIGQVDHISAAVLVDYDKGLLKALDGRRNFIRDWARKVPVVVAAKPATAEWGASIENAVVVFNKAEFIAWNGKNVNHGHSSLKELHLSLEEVAYRARASLVVTLGADGAIFCERMGKAWHITAVGPADRAADSHAYGPGDPMGAGDVFVATLAREMVWYPRHDLESHVMSAVNVASAAVYREDLLSVNHSRYLASKMAK